MTLFAVRQYRPAYFSGFTNLACHDVEEDKILDCPWFENFKHSGFKEFKIEPYGNERIIVAYYDDGKHWVAGFCCEEGSEMSKDWRYQEHEQL